MPMNFTPSERNRLLKLMKKFREMQSTLPNFEYGKNNITKQYQRLEQQKRKRSCPRKIHVIANTSLMPWLESKRNMRNKRVNNIVRSMKHNRISLSPTLPILPYKGERVNNIVRNMKHNRLSLSPTLPMFKQSVVKKTGGSLQRERILNKNNNNKIFVQTVRRVPNGNLTMNRQVYRKKNNKPNVVYLTKTKKPILISNRNKPYVLSSSGKRSYNPKAFFVKKGNIISTL